MSSSLPSNNPEPMTRRSNWLIASVALNLFLLGAIVSALLFVPRSGRLPFGPGGGGPPGFEHFGRDLSPEGRATLDRLRAGEEQQMHQHFEALRAARKAMDEAFTAERFDQAAFDAAFARMRGAESRMAEGMSQRIATLAQSLSLADRKAFAKSMQRLPIGPVGPMGPPGAGPIKQDERSGPR